jgi:hypothetical protein
MLICSVSQNESIVSLNVVCVHSVLLPGWVLTAWEGGGILKSYYPEVLSHEGVAAIALWVCRQVRADAVPKLSG